VLEIGSIAMSDISLLKGKKVLVVDDEPDILGVLEDLLDMCQVVKASNFEEAKSLFQSRDFDIAVLDIMGVDGYGLLRIANQKKIPAIMLTAHAFSPDNLVRTIKEGAASYIPKEEITHIAAYLIDVLKSKKEGKSPWETWQERLPSSYFEKRWGAAWKDSDQEFWETFKAGLKSRKSATGSQDKKKKP
jgi:DNA-binding NtrC family response regulator